MALAGTLNVGCGEYSYEILPPASKCFDDYDNIYMSWGSAVKGITNFCTELEGMGQHQEADDVIRTYFFGTSDQVDFSASFDKSTKVNKDTCTGAYTNYIKGCIKSCGAVTGWVFEYHAEPDKNNGYEWHASGNSPVGPQIWGCYAYNLQPASGNASMPLIAGS